MSDKDFVIDPVLEPIPSPDEWLKRETEKAEASDEEDDETLEKSVYSPRYGANLTSFQPGDKVPDGAIVVTGPRGGRYYYSPSGVKTPTSNKTFDQIVYEDSKLFTINPYEEKTLLDRARKEVSQPNGVNKNAWKRVKDFLELPSYARPKFKVFGVKENGELTSFAIISSGHHGVGIIEAVVGPPGEDLKHVHEEFARSFCKHAYRLGMTGLYYSNGGKFLGPVDIQDVMFKEARKNKLFITKYRTPDKKKSEESAIRKCGATPDRVSEISTLVDRTKIIPSKHIESTVSITIDPSSIRYVETKEGLPPGSVDGMFFHTGPYQGQVILDSFLRFGGNKDSVIHEVGHSVWKFLLSQDEKTEYDKLYRKRHDLYKKGYETVVSRYAQTSVEEDFAESYRAYLLKPETLYYASPEAYEWFEKHVFNTPETKSL